MTEYRTVNKTLWGEGAWMQEPDKVSWRDRATSLSCLIVRNPGGALCGYVGVGQQHPAHGRAYDPSAYDDDFNPIELSRVDAAIRDISVHGGLTFAGPCQEGDDPSVGVCHIPEPGEPDDTWWFGFDCSHYGDLNPGTNATMRGFGFEPLRQHETYRDRAYVEAEVASLAQQFKEMADAQ